MWQYHHHAVQQKLFYADVILHNISVLTLKKICHRKTYGNLWKPQEFVWYLYGNTPYAYGNHSNVYGIYMAIHHMLMVLIWKCTINLWEHTIYLWYAYGNMPYSYGKLMEMYHTYGNTPYAHGKVMGTYHTDMTKLMGTNHAYVIHMVMCHRCMVIIFIL